MTLPRASLSVINFQNLHVKKGSVSHAHEIHFLCATVLCDPLDPPPLGKSKNSYIILEIFNDFEGVTVLR